METISFLAVATVIVAAIILIAKAYGPNIGTTFLIIATAVLGFFAAVHH